MADQNPPELQGRLDNFQNRNAKKPTSRIGVGALAAGLGLGGAALAYVFAKRCISNDNCRRCYD